MVRRGFTGKLGLLLLSGCAWTAAAAPAPAHAQGQAPGSFMSSSCGPDNLLAGKRPAQWQDFRGNAALLTDGAIGPEGSQWDAPVAAVFDTGAGSVTYDLGQAIPIRGLYLQADANDTYKIQGSLDGTPGSYKLLVEIDNASDRGHGLRARSLQIPPMPVRFLRVGEGVGDNFYSISEFAAYCQVPIPFPPVFRQSDAPLAAVVQRPWYKFDWWEDHASARTEMVIALLALLLLAWAYRAEKTGKDVVMSSLAPKLICALSLLVHLALAVSIIFGTTWVPTWAALLSLYLSCEFTLLVTPLPAGFVTPLGFMIRRWRARRGSKSRDKKADVGEGTVAAPTPTYAAVVRNQLLVLVGICSFLAYWNFGAFHFGNYTHYWDTYHYYVGTKYFKEMSFDRLYDCASIADSEDPTLRRRVELRKIMNLRTNVLGSTVDILAHPEQCKKHFSAERWEKFKKDIEYFRNRHGVKRWEEAQTDHGYNATPVWNIVGTTLANLSPASDRQLWYLTRIDPLFIIGMALMIWWAFGWRVLCVALAVFATNFPSRFYWTGGAYLRWDWLFHMTAGVCLVKKGKPVFGGFLMAYSALLRVFPGFVFLGPLFVIVQQLLDQTKGRRWWQRLPARQLPTMIRRVDRSHRGVILGAILAVGTLGPLSLAVSGGIDSYKGFLQNSKKHTSTPLTNYMGWRTVMTYKEKEAGRYFKNDRLEDPWKDWKDARLRTFHHRKWLYVVGILAFVALLYRAVRGFAAWEAAALASMMIAVVPELTCYYYSFLIVMALLWAKRREAGIALLGVTAATGFIDWAPTQYIANWVPWAAQLRVMPTWLDEQYTWMSVATLLGIGYILYEFGFVSRSQPVAAPAGAPSPAGAGEEVAAPARRKPKRRKPRR